VSASLTELAGPGLKLIMACINTSQPSKYPFDTTGRWDGWELSPGCRSSEADNAAGLSSDAAHSKVKKLVRTCLCAQSVWTAYYIAVK